MFIVGCAFLLICNYQIVTGSKTIKTNEILMPFADHKENSPNVSWQHNSQVEVVEIQPIASSKYTSSRFQRLKGNDYMKPVVVRPADQQTDVSSSSPSSLIEVVAAGHSVSEIPMESFTGAASENLQQEDVLKEIIPPIVSKTEKYESLATTAQSAAEFVYPASGSLQSQKNEKHSDGEFSEAFTSEFPEIGNVEPKITPIPERDSTTISAPKKKKKVKKHRKLRKIQKPSHNFPSSSITTTSTPTSIETTQARLGESYLGGWNEEESTVVVTPAIRKSTTKPEPSLGSIINQFSTIPNNLPINDDKAIREYYQKYYEEWYKQHNQALPSVPIGVINSYSPTPSSPAPRKITIQLGRKTTQESTEPSPIVTKEFGITSTTEEPTKEQLDKICDYVSKLSKSFGIKDPLEFTKNNCSFVRGFYPKATCEQLQNVVLYCSTGVYIHSS